MQVDNLDNLKDCVKITAEILDEHGPLDWRKRADAQSARFGSRTGCVFGQIFGDALDGIEYLRRVGAISFSPSEHMPYRVHNDTTAKVFTAAALIYFDSEGDPHGGFVRQPSKLRDLWAQETDKEYASG